MVFELQLLNSPAARDENDRVFEDEILCCVYRQEFY
jgi:hypothetical protein